MPPNTTKMGNALAGKPASVSRFQAAVSASRVAAPFTIPGINVSCLMTLVGTDRLLQLDAMSRLRMGERKVALDYLTQDKYELQLAVYVLQDACRDDAPDKQPDPPPIGTLEEWGQLSSEVIATCWMRYNELRAQLDPLADDASVTTTEILQIRDAVEKKSSQSLRSFGLQKLCAYLLIMGDQQSTSPTHRSASGPTSQDSSNGAADTGSGPASADS